MTIFNAVNVGLAVAGLLLVTPVLLQRGRGAAALSAGGDDSPFGRRTGDALTGATVATFVLFLTLAAAADRLAH